MSFLLDALGKADHDRRQAEVPELRTYNQPRRSTLGRVLRGLSLIGLLVLCFALGYILRPYLEAMISGQADQDTSIVPVQSLEKSASEDGVVKSTQTPATDVPIEPANQAYSLEVISYSDYPAARFAMINGAMIHEGEVLDAGEVLLLIEPNAVVLEKAGKKIRLRM